MSLALNLTLSVTLILNFRLQARNKVCLALTLTPNVTVSNTHQTANNFGPCTLFHLMCIMQAACICYTTYTCATRQNYDVMQLLLCTQQKPREVVIIVKRQPRTQAVHRRNDLVTYLGSNCVQIRMHFVHNNLSKEVIAFGIVFEPEAVSQVKKQMQ